MKTIDDMMKFIKNCPDYKLFVIDLFCGAGGTTTGIEQAVVNGNKAAKVIICINHDTNAILSHYANHNDCLHFIEDIKTFDITPAVRVTQLVREFHPNAFILLHASLECTNFSKAKGGQPRDADSRTLAEHLFRYIEAIHPDYIQIENVEEFMSWGDLDENGKPVSRDAGRCYREWIDKVKQYGYSFKHRILNAADYGAYTSRKRFFGFFAKGSLPIVFPQPTHAKNGGRDLFGTIPQWKPVKDVLNFADEGESIFTRKKPLSDKTLERIYAGLIKFVAGGKDKFLLKYNSTNATTGKHTPPSVDDPCPVVSTQGRLGIIQPVFLSKYFSGHPESKNFSVEEPAHTVTAVDHHSLIHVGFIQQRNSGDPNHKVVSVERPARTITATGGNQELVQAAFIGRYNGQQNQEVNAVSIEDPAPTLTVRDRLSLVSSHFVVNEYSGGGQHSSIDDICPAVLTTPKQKIVQCKFVEQQSKTGGSIDNPRCTPPHLISSETGAYAIVFNETDSEPMRKIKEFMVLYGIVDIKMRMLRIAELKRIMGFPADYTLIGTQAEQKKYIGNAVEVNMARVMCEALAAHLIIATEHYEKDL